MNQVELPVFVRPKGCVVFSGTLDPIPPPRSSSGSPEMGGRDSGDVRHVLALAEFTLYLRPSLAALSVLSSLCLNPITDDGNRTDACSRADVRHVR